MTVTTTHDPQGGGVPRLVFSSGDDIETVAPHRVFDLRAGVTSIGSASDADLRLEGLAERHAEVRRDDEDEYIFVDLNEPSGSTVHGRPVGRAQLRTGALIVMGPWTVSFYREEFADHGRPHGGRQGGEFSLQTTQTTPRHRGATAEGGSDQVGDDSGEYFPAEHR